MIDFDKISKQVEQYGSTVHLNNGFRIYSENVPNSGLMSATINLRVGSYLEPPEDKGSMHLLEHCILNGSREFSDNNELKTKAASIGLLINGETNASLMRFPIGNKSGFLLRENFLEGFNIMSDLVYNPLFNEDTLIKEKKTVIREIIERSNNEKANQYQLIYKQINDRVNQKNQDLYNISGAPDTVNAVSIDKLINYHQDNFIGGHSFLHLTGDLFNGQDMLKEVKDALSTINPGRALPFKIYNKEDPFKGDELMNIKSSVVGNNSLVFLVFQTTPSMSLDDSKAGLLSKILGMPHIGLLFEEMRNKQDLVYSVNSYTSSDQANGFLVINYLVDRKNTDKSLKLINNIFECVSKGDFSDSIVSAAKADSMPTFLKVFQQLGWIASELEQRDNKELYGNEATNLEQIQHYFSLSKKDVVEAANQWLGSDRLTVIVNND